MIDVYLPAQLNQDTLRNGNNRGTQTYASPTFNNPSASNDNTRRNNNVRTDRGLHESYDWYDACYTRERNKGEH